MYKFYGYHATDSQNTYSILTDKFKYKHNKKHWLGNGVYFYTDKSLAKWWATNPSVQFGNKITNQTIIYCEFQIDSDRLLDLRKLNDFQVFTQIYFSDFLPKIKQGIINVDSKRFYEIRCSFCDYLKLSYNLQAIIGSFDIIQQPYLHENNRKIIKQLLLPFIETQICVFDQSIIINKKEVK